MEPEDRVRVPTAAIGRSARRCEQSLGPTAPRVLSRALAAELTPSQRSCPVVDFVGASM